MLSVLYFRSKLSKIKIILYFELIIRKNYFHFINYLLKSIFVIIEQYFKRTVSYDILFYIFYCV